MSPNKSDGQLAGQLLADDGRELVGRALDVVWSVHRPHQTGVDAPPEAVVRQVVPEASRLATDEQWVFWRPCLDDLCECHRPPSTEGVLDHLLALEDAPVGAIEEFIFKHGPIANCIHLRAHTDCVDLLASEERTQVGTGDAVPWSLYWEAPAAYRRYASIFRAFLTIAADLQAGQEGDRDLWRLIVKSVPEDIRHMSIDTSWEFAVASVPTDELIARGLATLLEAPDDPDVVVEMALRSGTGPDLLASALHAFMSEDPISLGFEWPIHDGDFADRPRIRLVTSTFGILTYQLAVALQGSLFAICSNCHRTYPPTRKPQSGRDNYCPACRDARKTAYKRRRQTTEDGSN